MDKEKLLQKLANYKSSHLAKQAEVLIEAAIEQNNPQYEKALFCLDKSKPNKYLVVGVQSDGVIILSFSKDASTVGFVSGTRYITFQPTPDTVELLQQIALQIETEVHEYKQNVVSKFASSLHYGRDEEVIKEFQEFINKECLGDFETLENADRRTDITELLSCKTWKEVTDKYPVEKCDVHIL